MYKKTVYGNYVNRRIDHMYAIRSKRTNRWFLGIDAHAGNGSSLRVRMDDTIPALFKTKELARIELLTNNLNPGFYEIIEVDLCISENVA